MSLVFAPIRVEYLRNVVMNIFHELIVIYNSTDNFFEPMYDQILRLFVSSSPCLWNLFVYCCPDIMLGLFNSMRRRGMIYKNYIKQRILILRMSMKNNINP